MISESLIKWTKFRYTPWRNVYKTITDSLVYSTNTKDAQKCSFYPSQSKEKIEWRKSGLRSLLYRDEDEFGSKQTVGDNENRMCSRDELYEALEEIIKTGDALGRISGFLLCYVVQW